MLESFRQLRSASRGFKISIVEGALTVFGSSLIGPMVTPLLIRLGADAGVIGLYTALVSATTPLMQILAALILDRFREHRLFIMTFFAGVSRALWFGVLLTTIGVWGDLWTVIALLCLSNAVGVLASLAWTDIMADLVKAEERGRLFAVRNTLLGLINLASLTFAKAIYDQLMYPQGYTIAIAFGASLMLAAAPLLYFYGDQVKPKGIGLGLKGVTSAFKDSQVFKDSFSLAFWNFAVSMVGGVWNYHMYAAYGADESWFTTLNLVAGLMGTIANPPWGSFYDRFGPRATFVLSGLGIVAVPILFPFLPNLAGQAALQTYSTFMWSGFNLAAFNYALSYGSEARHLYIAVYNTFPSLFSALGTLVGVQVYNKATVWVFFISGLGRVFALAVLYRVSSSRGLAYEELKVFSNLYPIFLATRVLAVYAYAEFILALKLLYAALLAVLVLSALTGLFIVLRVIAL